MMKLVLLHMSYYALLISRNIISTISFSAPFKSRQTVAGKTKGVFLYSTKRRELSEVFRDAYKEGETDGIIQLIQNEPDIFDTYASSDLLSYCIEAATTRLGSSVTLDKRQTSGTINALIASCCSKTSPRPDIAKILLENYQGNADALSLTPDLVTYCCAYAACSNTDDEYKSFAQEILDQACKFAKKNGGSRRRKALSASQRKKPFVVGDDDNNIQEALAAYNITVLFDTDDYLGLVKPAGMICYHSHLTSDGKISRKKKKKKQSQDEEDDYTPDFSLEDVLGSILNIPLSDINPSARGIVHRLDRGVSGCILIAKTNSAHAKLLTQFFIRNSKKSYLALVSPNDQEVQHPLQEEGIINLPVHGKLAKSSYQVIRTYNNYNDNNDTISLIRLRAHTGRKHQIRVHCAEGLHHPILLDPLYYLDSKQNKNHDKSLLFTQSKVFHKILQNNRSKKMGNSIFLHAESLVIPDLCIDLKSDIPPWWIYTFPPLADDKLSP